MADEPTLLAQTLALGKVLKTVSDRDPLGTPSQSAAATFAHWLALAGSSSREQRYFVDIAENYDIFQNTNQDLFRVFEFLHPYIEVADDEDGEEPGAFIGLPMAP